MIGFLFVVYLVLLPLSINQAVVSQHTAEIEFQHAQRTEERMGDLTHRIYLVGKTGCTQPITMDLGVDYQPLALAINPALPAGRLHTRTAGQLQMFVGNDAVNLTTACGFGGTRVRSRSVAYGE